MIGKDGIWEKAILAISVKVPKAIYTICRLLTRAKKAAEAADVLYHLLVMLAARDVTLADVLAELERREGTSGIAEKAARG